MTKTQLEYPETTVQVSPLSAHIGAEIHGVDLTRPLSTEEIAAIRGALIRTSPAGRSRVETASATAASSSSIVGTK